MTPLALCLIALIGACWSGSLWLNDRSAASPKTASAPAPPRPSWLSRLTSAVNRIDQPEEFAAELARIDDQLRRLQQQREALVAAAVRQSQQFAEVARR